MDSSIISTPDATNYKYTTREDPSPTRKVFISYANSYYGKFLASKFLFEENNYKVYGTLQDDQAPEVLDVAIMNAKSENFLDDIAEFDLIICDINQDKEQFEESRKIVDFLELKLENGEEMKLTLVLISTIMTWAASNQATGEILTDKNYRKRRPHPCYKNHLLLERKVLNLQRKYPGKVQSAVICPGIIYGEDEDIFHHIFKNCYFNHSDINVFMPATNILPVIYIHDFTEIVSDVARNFPEGMYSYILAVQPKSLTALDVVRSFGELMSGSDVRINICHKNYLFLTSIDQMPQRVFNHMVLNLNLESEYLAAFKFQVNGSNFKDFSQQIGEEFYNSRKLKPVKILIDGNSDLAKTLSQYYCLHLIDRRCFVKNSVCRLAIKIHETEEYLQKLDQMIENCSQECLKALNYRDITLKIQNELDLWKQQKEKLNKFLDLKTHNFEDIRDILIDRLSSYACSKHQGYVLSNFRLNSKEAAEIFLDDDEDNFKDDIKPDFVIFMNNGYFVDEDDCENSEEQDNENDQLLRHWRDQLDTCSDEFSLMNFFLDHGIVPMEYNASNDYEIKEIFEKLKHKIGKPSHYGFMSKTELEETEKLKMEILKREAFEREDRDKENLEKELEVLNNQLMEQKKLEYQKMEERSVPVREYLSTYIYPKVTEAFLEVTKRRPENPIEFIAKYLFHQASIDARYDLNVDQDVLNEFRRLNKCEYDGI